METDDSIFDLPLYHGTRDAAARAILRGGFRRSKSSSYTGTGICFSQAISTAYEYGAYETQGCVLEARLSRATRWTEEMDGKSDSHQPDRHAFDAFFQRSGMDALCTFGGNVWVIWTPSALLSVRRLSHREAIQRLCAEFEDEGPCRYNGLANDYASIWWRQEADDLNLTRFPDHQRELTARLKRFMGRSHSTRD